MPLPANDASPVNFAIMAAWSLSLPDGVAVRATSGCGACVPLLDWRSLLRYLFCQPPAHLTEMLRSYSSLARTACAPKHACELVPADTAVIHLLRHFPHAREPASLRITLRHCLACLEPPMPIGLSVQAPLRLPASMWRFYMWEARALPFVADRYRQSLDYYSMSLSSLRRSQRTACVISSCALLDSEILVSALALKSRLSQSACVGPCRPPDLGALQ